MTVSDVLETVFVIKGADALIQATLAASGANATLAAATGVATAATAAQTAAQAAMLGPLAAAAGLHAGIVTRLASAVAGFQALAAAQGVAAAATAVLNTAMNAFNPILLIIVATIAALVAGFKMVSNGLDAFSKSEAAIGRLATELRDMGNVFPAQELVDFSTQLQHTTGIAHTAIERLGGLAASFGLTRAQIEKTIPIVLDIGVARGLDPEQVLRRLFAAAGGRRQGLRALGINPDAVKGDLKDINNLIGQLGKQFAGTAEAFRNTLPGMEQALSSAQTSFSEALGRLFSPERMAWLKIWTALLEGATRLLNAAADYWKIPTAADLGKGKPNELALKGDPEQTAALKGIEKNTAQTSEFIQHVLGGGGEVARSAFTRRDARMSFGI